MVHGGDSKPNHTSITPVGMKMKSGDVSDCNRMYQIVTGLYRLNDIGMNKEKSRQYGGFGFWRKHF